MSKPLDVLIFISFFVVFGLFHFSIVGVISGTPLAGGETLSALLLARNLFRPGKSRLARPPKVYNLFEVRPNPSGHGLWALIPPVLNCELPPAPLPFAHL